LPQDGAIRTDPDIVTQLAGHDGDATIGESEHAMITCGSHVTPARLFQRLDYVADF
jgi:hypothetical protein